MKNAVLNAFCKYPMLRASLVLLVGLILSATGIVAKKIISSTEIFNNFFVIYDFCIVLASGLMTIGALWIVAWLYLVYSYYCGPHRYFYRH